jgi:hypothetical protein
LTENAATEFLESSDPLFCDASLFGGRSTGVIDPAGGAVGYDLLYVPTWLLCLFWAFLLALTWCEVRGNGNPETAFPVEFGRRDGGSGSGL